MLILTELYKVQFDIFIYNFSVIISILYHYIAGNINPTNMKFAGRFHIGIENKY